MGKAKKWILAKHFDGMPKLSDLKLDEEELPSLKDGDFMVEAEFLSVDPYMRPYSKMLPEGSPMIGSQVTKVCESKNPAYPVGCRVVNYKGWRNRTVITKQDMEKEPDRIYKVQDIGKLSSSVCLGVLGMPGATAYFGFLKLCRPKPGEVVLVSTAAGAVGSIVGQIAKMKGCKVIGYTGSDDKVKYLKEELGFDAAFNYKTSDIDKTLKAAAPDGVDCYFDNVGGDFTQKVIINHMKTFGRIAICGSIDAYNDKDGQAKTGEYSWRHILSKQLCVEGFLVHRWAKEFPKAWQDIQKWITEGKVKYREYVTDGFEKMPEAFISLLNGKNIGKAVVKA